MRKLIGVNLLLAGLTAFAGNSKVITTEEVYITQTSKKLIKMITSHPELTIDHLSSNGFELYGPKGLKTWLDDIGVDYKVAQAHSHNKNDNIDDAGYPTFSEITSFLKDLAAKYPHIMKLESIGKSVEGRELWVVKISDNVAVDELEPEFKYISSMHGDEITGRELSQFLIKDLLEAYGKNERITKLINNTELYIMPSMNPDGSKRRQRSNANGVDLNRNFPDWVRGDSNTTSNREAETLAVMKFQSQRQFALSANFHGGAVVVNYPWDSTYDLHPQDDLVTNFSLEYANLNPAMRSSREFDRGITNGAAWYVLNGGMQDWSHFWYNDLQVTIELSDQKWPRYRNIPGFYKDNKASLLRFPELIHQGAGFAFADKTTSGRVKITNTTNNKVIGSFGFDRGEFYKVLDVGVYDFEVLDSNNKAFGFTVNVDKNTIQKNGNFVQL